MGRIKDWLIKHEKGVCTGIMISGITAFIGTMSLAGYKLYQEYLKTVPEGDYVKAEADGIITPEEEKTISEYLKNGEPRVYTSRADILDEIAKGPVTEKYDNTIRELVNEYNEFLASEIKWNRNPIGDNLHIYISSHDETVNKCNIDKWYGGCYRSWNSTIYLPILSPIELFEGIEHEIGHSLRSMPYNNNYLMELPSQANEFYAFFRLYNLNKEIGKYYAANNKPTAMEYVKKECNIEEKALPYMLGAIGFLVQANKAEGNLELAMRNVILAPESQLEKDTKDAISEYENICKAYIGEYEQLLQQPGLLSGFEQHMNEDEAKEFLKLLSAWNHPK